LSQITTHILDTSRGHPAKNVKVTLSFINKGQWDKIAEGVTNEDGRITDLLKTDELLKVGVYKLTFETGLYFEQNDVESFYPYVEIVFRLEDNDHYHVPLLLNPYGYSTYRGS
jgi:5-hydroxyisourate hydrolase